MINNEFKEKLQDYRNAAGKIKKQYFADSNIISIGVGWKEIGKEQLGELCIKFSVRVKGIFDSQYPKKVDKYIEVDGVNYITDVVERDYKIESNEEVIEYLKRYQDRVIPGASISHHSVGSGSVAAIVLDNETDEPLALSCFHVLSGYRRKVGDDIWQPGGSDGGSSSTTLGVLYDYVLNDRADAAVATIERGECINSLLDLGRITNVREAGFGENVLKIGKSTGLTYGYISQDDITLRVHYGRGIGFKFIDGYEVKLDLNHHYEDELLSRGGDSGCGYFIEGTEVNCYDLVGIHISGSSSYETKKYAFFCSAVKAMEDLKVRLL